MELFTKENKLPPELQSFAYDVDSVMHFGERDYSKNGHRTIIFKDFLRNPVKQNRVGLTPLDLRKIDVVYGPECRKRDRQEKLEICQNYPGVARKKREVASEVINLRVNRDITPPPNVFASRANDSLKVLGIENEVQDVVDEIYKVSSKALRNARAKYCNETKPDLRESEDRVPRDNLNPDILGIIETIADYAKHMVDNAVANLTEFCKESENMELYQRARCPYYQDGRPCPQTYRSTKSGRVKYSTQHRPVYIQSTKHRGNAHLNKNFDPLRTGNVNDTIESRRKRHLDATTEPVTVKDKDNINSRRDVTRVGIQRSRDEEATTVDILRRNDQETADQRRLKRSVEVTAPVNDNPDLEGRRNDATSKKDNEDSDKGDLRTATDLPVNKHHPERSLRRIFQKKKALRSDSWADSNVSYEKEDSPRRSQEAETESNVKSRNDGSHFEGKRQETDKRKLSRLPRLMHSGNRQKQDGDGVRRPDIEEGRGPKPRTVRLSKENVEFYSERKWPDGVIRYILEADPEYDLEDVRRRLEEVNSILKRRTCARLEEITQDETEQFEDYLVVDTGPDFVTGRVGGKQNFGSLELFRGGQHRQHTAMVVMAMLGFYFELARHDRDEYVRVHLRHVRPDKLHHFEKIKSDATFPLPYDYKSATHPAWQFWRHLGKSGISTVATLKSRDPDGSIMRSLGQHARLLSDLDLVKINSVYGTRCFRNRNTRDRNSGKKRQDWENNGRSV